MELGILLDQPDLARPEISRHLRFGRVGAPAIAILNGRARDFEGGSDAPALSLKWVPNGSAGYRTEGRSYRLSGTTSLLLNRGQAYRLNMAGASETFVLFFPGAVADAAWQAHVGKVERLPEVPTSATRSSAALQTALTTLRAECRYTSPNAERLRELCCAALTDIVALVAQRRDQVMRIPAVRRSTRDELLRRLLRAEAYLGDTGANATLAGAADAAALSPFHLIRLFNAVFGETPLAYGARKRLERAHDDLVRTSKSITQIAEAAGYESRTAFDRAFVRQFGYTPGSVGAGPRKQSAGRTLELRHEP